MVVWGFGCSNEETHMTILGPGYFKWRPISTSPFTTTMSNYSTMSAFWNESAIGRMQTCQMFESSQWTCRCQRWLRIKDADFKRKLSDFCNALGSDDCVRSGGAQASFRVRFQAVNVPIFSGPQSSSKGNLFVRVRFGEAPSTVEDVDRVRCCCLLSWKTNTGNAGRTVLGHRPVRKGFTENIVFLSPTLPLAVTIYSVLRMSVHKLESTVCRLGAL